MASMDNLSFKVPLEDALDRWRKSVDLTCADMAGGLIGSFRGRRDSSTNQRYLDEAIVADATRASRRESEVKRTLNRKTLRTLT
jgi:hypothetical protein